MEQNDLRGSRPRSVGSQRDAGAESTTVASWVTDNMGFSVSESTVSMRREGLVKKPEMRLAAGKEYS